VIYDASTAHRDHVEVVGHHHARIRAEVGGVPCIGLNIVGRPGHLVAVGIEERGREWRILGEWPEEGGQIAPVWPKSEPRD